MKALLSSWYVTVGAVVAVGVLSVYVHFLHGQLGDTRAELRQSQAQVAAMTESMQVAGRVLEQESQERARLTRELRASRTEFRELQDRDWLKWKDQRLPQAVLDRYQQEAEQ